MKRTLRNVAHRQGRLDVLLYQLAERWMAQVEVERGLVGLREYLLPIVEKTIVNRVPAENLIPSELRSCLMLLDQNLRGRGC